MRSWLHFGNLIFKKTEKTVPEKQIYPETKLNELVEDELMFKKLSTQFKEIDRNEVRNLFEKLDNQLNVKTVQQLCDTSLESITLLDSPFFTDHVCHPFFLITEISDLTSPKTKNI